MTPRRLAALAALIVILLVAGVALTRWARPSVPAVNPLRDKVDEISALALGEGDKTVRIEKTPDGWMMTSPVKDKADASSVGEFKSVFRRFTVGSIVSENEKHFGEFELDPARRFKIQVFVGGDAQPIFDGYVGKMARSYTDSYFQFAGEKRVRILSGFPSFLFHREANTLRDRRVLPIPAAAADKIDVSGGGKSWSLRRSSATWTNGASRIPTATASTLTDDLSKWAARDFAPGGSAFDHPAYTFDIAAGTTSVSIQIDAAPASPTGDTLIHESGRNAVFIVPSAIVKPVLDALKSIR